MNDVDTNDINEAFESNASSHLPNIERLEVVSPYPFPNGIIKFSGLKELCLSFYGDTSDIFNQLPRSLECSEISMETISESAFDFVLSCQHLKKLKITTLILDSSDLQTSAKEMQSLCEVHIILISRIELQDDFQKPARLDHLFLGGKQLKVICLEYTQNGVEAIHSEYKIQIEIARKFVKMINETINVEWLLSHRIYGNDDDDTASEPFTYPYLQLSFKKMNKYSKNKNKKNILFLVHLINDFNCNCNCDSNSHSK